MSEPKRIDEFDLILDLKNYRFGPIWDGNLNSKSFRDRLVDKGLLERAHGFQFLTERGITVLWSLGLLNESTWREKTPQPSIQPDKTFESLSCKAGSREGTSK